MTATDKDIITAIRSKSGNGFRMLLGKYKEPVYWHIRRLLVSHDDSEDAMQEAFIRMYRSFNSLKEDSSLPVWIYRIATNEALRVIEHRKPGQVSLASIPSKAESVATTEYIDYSDLEAVKLQKAIHTLPEKQQLTFNMRYYDGLGYEDIAQVTGSSAATAKVNYSIAKNKIIQYMNSHD